MKRGYNVFRRFCAFVLGAVFLISGILKLMDPVGSEFIMKSYFSFLHIGFMDFSAKFFGVAFALTEAVLGAAQENIILRTQRHSDDDLLEYHGFAATGDTQ